MSGKKAENKKRDKPHEHEWADRGDDHFWHERHKKLVYWRWYCKCGAEQGYVNDRTFF